MAKTNMLVGKGTEGFVVLEGFIIPTPIDGTHEPINRGVLLARAEEGINTPCYAKKIVEDGDAKYFVFEKKEALELNDKKYAIGYLSFHNEKIIKTVQEDEKVKGRRFITADEIEKALKKEGFVEVNFNTRVGRTCLGTVDLSMYRATTATTVNKAEASVLDTAKKRVVAEGILTETELKEREAFLNKHDVSANLQTEMFNRMVKYSPEELLKVAKPVTEFIDPAREYVQMGLAGLLFDSQALLFEGGKATGKNLLANTFSWLMKAPLEIMSFNVDLNNDTLFGSKTFKEERELTAEERRDLFLAYIAGKGDAAKEWLEKIEELTEEKELETFFESNEMANQLANGIEVMLNLANGKHELVFDKTQFVEAVERGYILVCDEFNLLPSSMSAIIHSLFDHNRILNVPGFGSIKPHKNFMMIATQNPPSLMYSGAEKNNSATRSRFSVLQFVSLANIDEVLTGSVPGAKPEHVKLCNELYKKIVEVLQVSGKRKEFREKGAVIKLQVDETLLDTRGFIRALKQMAYTSPRLALRSCVIAQSTTAEVVASLEQYLDLLVPSIIEE